MDVLKILLKVVITVAVVAHVLYLLYRIKKDKELPFALRVWREFRPRMIVAALTLQFLGFFSYFFLSRIPLLTYGCTNILWSHSGNILLLPFTEKNIVSRVVGLFTMIFLLLIIPHLARAEEMLFRQGGRTWRGIGIRSVFFGFAHCFVGVSLAAALILSFIGLYFASVYRSAFFQKLREYPDLKLNFGYDLEFKHWGDHEKWRLLEEVEKHAVFRSTVAHACFNTVGIIIFSIYLCLPFASGF